MKFIPLVNSDKSAIVDDQGGTMSETKVMEKNKAKPKNKSKARI